MKQTLIISGMSCQHCVHAVSAALASVARVESVQVDLGSGQAHVEGQAAADALIAAVIAAGYGAESAHLD
jgi:copper chaperone